MLETKHNFFVAVIFRNHVFDYKGRWPKLRRSRTTSSRARFPLSHLRLQGTLDQSAQDDLILMNFASRGPMRVH